MIGWSIGSINVLIGFLGCLWSCGGLSLGCDGLMNCDGLLSHDGLLEVFDCLPKSTGVAQM
jgi:hypothetical protein